MEAPLVNFNSAIVDFRLYKNSLRRIDFSIDAYRSSIRIKKLTCDIDYKKMRQAVRANFVHACDSEVLARMSISVHSIHDCLMIGIKNISITLDEYNEVLMSSSTNIAPIKSCKINSIFTII